MSVMVPDLRFLIGEIEAMLPRQHPFLSSFAPSSHSCAEQVVHQPALGLEQLVGSRWILALSKIF